MIQNMNQNKQNQIKITFIESPINQVMENFESTFSNNTNSDQASKFAMISKRLSENIKKIQENQTKTNSGKRFSNFKQIKNSIISKDAQVIKSQIQCRMNNIRERSNQIKIEKERVNSRQKQEARGSRQLVSRKLFEEQAPTTKELNSSKSHSSLLNCLNEIKEVKKTIKNLKERCKNGTNEKLRKQKIPEYYLNSNSAKKRYVSHSGSKYNYTNYHDLSQKKLIQLSERRQKSQKQFNWISNVTGVKQFTITTGPEQTIVNQPFTIQIT